MYAKLEEHILVIQVSIENNNIYNDEKQKNSDSKLDKIKKYG